MRAPVPGAALDAPRRWPTNVFLALVAFVPLLWNSVGKVSADTKTYLTLDPGKLLAKASSMWDPAVGLGTVTHQTIGYLFPLGPYYWAMQHLGVPDWLTQRLWLGLIFFAAGRGVVFLAEALGWEGRGLWVAALAYQLSPYVLDYAARISVILLPWAGLGWLIGCTIHAVREGGWRWPARFALVVALIGSVNATSLVLVGIGPLVWLAHALVSRQVAARRTAAAVGRIGVLSVAVSLWWIVALRVQGAYGIPILRYTETYEAVARASTAPEVLRGLGYWFFYGQDKVGPWVGPAKPYTQSLWLIITSYGIVGLGLVAAAAVRWRHRSFVVLLLVAGIAVSVGAHPYGSPSPAGGLFKRFVATTAGLALRSTPRAVPLVALALALLLGAGVSALGERLSGASFVPAAGACLLVAANLPSLWTGHLYTASILRDDKVPAYWTQAAAAIDAGNRATRVLETPGSDFADYRWGGTIDPITPGLTDRDYVARELIPYGSPPAADLLNAFERRIQDRVDEPTATLPIMRLLSVGTISLRSDLQYERYRLPRPRPMWTKLLTTPGLSTPAAFGTPVTNTPIARLPLIDEEALATDPALPDPPPVALFDVPSAPAIVHAESDANPTIVAADGEGLIDLAAAGQLDGRGPLLAAGGLAATPGAIAAAAAKGADLVLTDSNRKQARRWGSVRENLGYTEAADETPLKVDLNDNRLDTFPGTGTGAQTVTVQRGVARVQATGYGNPITYTPEDRALMAIDGDPSTAWRVGAFADVTGERIEVQLAAPTTTNHVVLLQPIDGPRNRWLTRVRLRFDGKAPVLVDLDDSSRTSPGQRIDFSSRTFTTLSIEIVATNFTKLPGYRGISAVGFAEIGIEGVRADEALRLPTDLLGQAGSAAATNRLTIVTSRDRASTFEANRSDPELALDRLVTLPTARTFTLAGTARLSDRAGDATLWAVIGEGSAPLTASARLPGLVASAAASAVDGDRTTAWQTPIDQPLQQLTAAWDAPTTLDHLNLAVLSDGRHSVPTRLTIAADGGEPRSVIVPPTTDGPPGTVVDVPLTFPAITATRLVITIAEVRAVRSPDYFSELPVALPVGIAELGLPSGARPPSASISAGCRDDLLLLDGNPLSVQIVGSTRNALGGHPLTIAPCGPVTLGAGPHELRARPGRDTGIDIDRLVLDSAATTPAHAATAAPAITATPTSRTGYRVSVPATTQPFWLVLGQSHNAGWHATVAGRDLGPSTLVNGYANGWLVTPPAAGQPFEVTLSWTPQHVVRIGLAVSAFALVLVLVLAVWRRRASAVTVAAEVPLRSNARRPFGIPTPAAVVVAGIMFFVLAGPTTAAVAAATVVVGRWLPAKWRRRLPLVPGLLMAAVIGYVALKLHRYAIPTDLDWPRAFEPTHVIAWCAVAVAAVLALDEHAAR